MDTNHTELELRETRAALEHALRESLRSGGSIERLIAAANDFATANLTLTPELTLDAAIDRVFRLMLHVARTTASREARTAHPPLERLVYLGRVCADALRSDSVARNAHEVRAIPRPPADLAPSSAQEARAAAKVAREKARAIVREALRTQMRSAALRAATNAELRAAERARDELRSSISRYVDAMRLLGEPAESVVTEVRVLTLECAGDVCAPEPAPRCEWAEALHDDIVRLAIESYCDAPAA